MRLTGAPKISVKGESMNRSKLRLVFLGVVVAIVTGSPFGRTTALVQPVKTAYPIQFDDPYAEFRNARYSNAGLLSERNELKLGTQLHREVTKKYNLTDVGLDRVERLGQRCARASL